MEMPSLDFGACSFAPANQRPFFWCLRRSTASHVLYEVFIYFIALHLENMIWTAV